jgi:hypothetical protein
LEDLERAEREGDFVAAAVGAWREGSGDWRFWLGVSADVVEGEDVEDDDYREDWKERVRDKPKGRASLDKIPGRPRRLLHIFRRSVLLLVSLGPFPDGVRVRRRIGAVLEQVGMEGVGMYWKALTANVVRGEGGEGVLGKQDWHDEAKAEAERERGLLAALSSRGISPPFATLLALYRCPHNISELNIMRELTEAKLDALRQLGEMDEIRSGTEQFRLFDESVEKLFTMLRLFLRIQEPPVLQEPPVRSAAFPNFGRLSDDCHTISKVVPNFAELWNDVNDIITIRQEAKRGGAVKGEKGGRR